MVQTDQQTFRIRGGVDAAHESKGEQEINKIFKINVLIKIYTYLATVADVDIDEEDGTHIEEGYSIDLDSHANIPVVGRHAYIISDTGEWHICSHSPLTIHQCKFAQWMPWYNTTTHTMDNRAFW